MAGLGVNGSINVGKLSLLVVVGFWLLERQIKRLQNLRSEFFFKGLNLFF